MKMKVHATLAVALLAVMAHAAAHAAVHPAVHPGAHPGASPAGSVASALNAQHGGPQRQPQPYLGVDLKDISDDQVSSLKLHDSRGAEITQVDHDAPAGKMGLRERDVILQMNGVQVEGEEHIRRMLSATPPGRNVVLIISRDGQQMTVSALMADRAEVERRAFEQHFGPQPAQAPSSNITDEAAAAGSASQSAAAAPATHYSKSFLGSLLTSPTYTGVLLERMGPQLATFFGVPGNGGLLVRNVENNSPAAMAGIHAGDVVLRANSQNVNNMNDWARAIKEAKGRPVSVVVYRDHVERTLVVTPDTKKRSELEMPLRTGDDFVLARLARLTRF